MKFHEILFKEYNGDIPERLGHFFLPILTVENVGDILNESHDFLAHTNVESSRDVVECAPPGCYGVANAESVFVQSKFGSHFTL